MPQSGDNPGQTWARRLLCALAVAGVAFGAWLLRPQESTAQVRSQAEPRAEAPTSGEASIGTVDLSEIRLPLSEIRPERGLCFMARIPLLSPNERDDRRTGLRLFEDDVELTQAASLHAEIREHGGGRFSHWGPVLYFSSTDGSDPTTNGRRYTIVFDRSSLIDDSLWSFTPVAHIPMEEVKEGEGFEYVYTLPLPISAWPSDSDTLNGSRLVLVEDGVPLAFPHARRDEVVELGGGRYRHFGPGVRFSTSDNSDPRTNGRRYAIALADPWTHEFMDPFLPPMPPLVESLAPPEIAWPREGEVVSTAQPTIRVANADPDLLYYWELDVVPTFDSSSLHRRPRAGRSHEGPHVLRVLDSDPDFSAEFTPPYRLGILADHHVKPTELRHGAIMAARLGYGLEVGEAELREVHNFIHQQFYPLAESAGICSPADTWSRDRGYCASVNFLAASILGELGYRTRRAQVRVPSPDGGLDEPISSHSSLEVFLHGRWSIFDPWFGFFLYHVSFADLAAEQRLQYLAVRYLAASEGDSEAREWREIYLSDYALGRRYDQFDNWFAPMPDPETERLAFSGEPAHRPDLPFHTLWPEPRMKVWVRVRSVAVSPEAVDAWLMPSPRARELRPETIVVSPWTVVSFSIDLKAAYGNEREPR